MLMSLLHHADVILILVSHVGRVNWYSGWGQPIRAKKTRGARLRAWAATSSARAAMSDVRFRRRFHQWLRRFLLYTVVWSKHNFDNFHF
jgi:hypothetical protein